MKKFGKLLVSLAAIAGVCAAALAVLKKSEEEVEDVLLDFDEDDTVEEAPDEVEEVTEEVAEAVEATEEKEEVIEAEEASEETVTEE